MTKNTTTHKRCSAPFPHAGGSWVFAHGKLEREAAPDDAQAAEAAQVAAETPTGDAESGDGKRGRRFGK